MEQGLPASPFPSEIDYSVEDHELAVGSECLEEGEDTRRFARRHTLPSLTDDAQRSCPALSARCPAQTYTAVTFSTPDAVFAKGDDGPLSSGKSSTQSTIVCGENNWRTRVDWETTSMTSGSSSGSASTLSSQIGLVSDDLRRDKVRNTSPDPGRSFRARHHSAGGFTPGFHQAAHRYDPESPTTVSDTTFNTAAGRELRSSSETPLISAAALWEPGDPFSPATHGERRATINHSEDLAKVHPREPPEQARSISLTRPYSTRKTKHKEPAHGDAAKSLRQWDAARVIRERTVEPPKPDHVGIYEAMTGSTIVRRRTSLPCAEDHRPHICLHELSDESE